MLSEIKYDKLKKKGDIQMNKKMMYGVIIAIIVIALLLGAYFLFFRENGKREINLEELNNQMAQQGEFDQMATMDIDKQVLSSIYGIEENLVQQVIGKMPMMNVQASLYLVIEATDGNVETVKEKLEEYGKSYEEQWSRYLPAQYELVQQRKIGTNGNYAYFIVCEKAQDLEKLVK